MGIWIQLKPLIWDPDQTKQPDLDPMSCIDSNCKHLLRIKSTHASALDHYIDRDPDPTSDPDMDPDLSVSFEDPYCELLAMVARLLHCLRIQFQTLVGIRIQLQPLMGIRIRKNTLIWIQ